MFRILSATLVVGMAAVLVLPGTAVAADGTLSMRNYSFAPKIANLEVGACVFWANDSDTVHTATGDEGSAATWDTGDVSPGQTSVGVCMFGAGTYAYHCTYHFGLGMRGRVGLRDKVAPPGGPVGTLFTVTVASMNAVDWVYDIQKLSPGGTFQNWMMGVTSYSVLSDSHGAPTGTYGFRSRIRLRNGDTSGYSPPVSVKVTP
jgi:plastocyanin